MLLSYKYTIDKIARAREHHFANLKEGGSGMGLGRGRGVLWANGAATTAERDGGCGLGEGKLPK